MKRGTYIMHENNSMGLRFVGSVFGVRIRWFRSGQSAPAEVVEAGPVEFAEEAGPVELEEEAGSVDLEGEEEAGLMELEEEEAPDSDVGQRTRKYCNCFHEGKER